jgi:hypothetical protein
MSNLKEAGVRVPHLNFYVPEKELKYSEKNAKYEAPEVLEARDEHTIRRGLQSFFDDHGVVLKPSTQSPQYCSKVDELQSLDYLDAEDIPEQFRLDRERLEETANKVRRILKQQNAASQPAA